MRFRAKNSASCEEIALLRANQIARITSDFKMGVINPEIGDNPKVIIIATACGTTSNILYTESVSETLFYAYQKQHMSMTNSTTAKYCSILSFQFNWSYFRIYS